MNIRPMGMLRQRRADHSTLPEELVLRRLGWIKVSATADPLQPVTLTLHAIPIDGPTVPVG